MSKPDPERLGDAIPELGDFLARAKVAQRSCLPTSWLPPAARATG
jgi:hypothetical protein